MMLPWTMVSSSTSAEAWSPLGDSALTRHARRGVRFEVQNAARATPDFDAEKLPS